MVQPGMSRTRLLATFSNTTVSKFRKQLPTVPWLGEGHLGGQDEPNGGHWLVSTLGAVHENHIRPFSETVWCVQTAPLLMETPLLPGFGTLRLGATWCRAPIFHFHSEQNTVTLGTLLALLSRKSRGPNSQDFVHSVPKCATSLTAFHFLQYWDPPLGWQPANHVVPFAAACPPKSDSGGPHSSPHLSVFCQTRQAPEDMDSLSLGSSMSRGV